MSNGETRLQNVSFIYSFWLSAKIYLSHINWSSSLIYKFIFVFIAGIRDYTTTLRINSIELLKPVDKTIDRAGYEKPLNKNPLNGYE